MAGVYIPKITKEMFQNAPLEAIEELMASGEIIEVPDHGDLIDRDEMRKEMTVFCNRRVEDAAMTGNREIRVDWNDALDFIKNASVVIPAERREE